MTTATRREKKRESPNHGGEDEDRVIMKNRRTLSSMLSQLTIWWETGQAVDLPY